MIAKLTGIVDSTGDGWAVIDVGGVGYLTSCSRRTLAHLSVGESTRLLVETHVRDDAIQLYGFAERGEREWFRMLTTVQGVGAKAALSILGVLSPETLIMAIASGDKGAITRAAGVGPRLAARIVAELRDKTLPQGTVQETALGRSPVVTGGVAEDAIAALVGLGFRPVDAMGAVSQSVSRLGDEATIEAVIRAGLAHLAPPEAGS